MPAKMPKIALARLLFLVVAALTAAAAVGVVTGGALRWHFWPQSGHMPVGMRMMKVPLPALPTPMTGAVWYPATAGSKERPVWYSSSIWGLAARNAAPAQALHKRPLIILAHGWRGTLFDLSWLGEALARQGFVVATVAQPDVDASSWDDEQGPKVWYRASVLRALIDGIAHDDALAHATDTGRVVAIGHSAGGSAIFMLGGAKLDPARFASIYPQSAPVVDGNFADARLVGLIALDPGTGPAFAPSGLARVRVPALILSGGQDQVAPEETNAGYYARFVPQAMWRSIAAANHYSFMYECSAYGRLRHFGSCLEASPDISRQAIHAEALTAITAFLQTLH